MWAKWYKQNSVVSTSLDEILGSDKDLDGVIANIDEMLAIIDKLVKLADSQNPGTPEQNPTGPDQPKPNPAPDQPKPTPENPRPLKQLKKIADVLSEKIVKVEKNSLPQAIRELKPVLDKTKPNYFGKYYTPTIPDGLKESGYTLAPYTLGNEITQKPNGYNYDFYYLLVKERDKDRNLNELFNISSKTEEENRRFFEQRVVVVKINLV